MIAQEFQAQVERTPRATAIRGSQGAISFADLWHEASAVAQWLREHNLPGCRVAAIADSPASLIAAAVGADAANVQLMLVDAADARRAAAFLGDDDGRVFVDIKVERVGAIEFLFPREVRPITSLPPGTVGMLTSGTSGPPKLAIHRWENLLAAVHREDRFAGKCWLLAYDAARFAGVQVWLQALLTGGTICVPTSREVGSVLACLLNERVQIASGTPTFWRLLLQTATSAQLAQLPLEQITLGGETVDQPLLDALQIAFPKARITHIYASTEMGVCFSVSDGRSGFPAAWLGDASRTIGLRRGHDGALEIRSPRQMLNVAACETDHGWFQTGDLIEIEGDRAIFVGRVSDTINVGGVKVRPRDVENCIRGVPGVRDVRVAGIASSLVGQLVGADIEPDGTVDDETLRQNVLTTSRSRLSKPQIPARIRIVPTLATNSNWKRTRATETVHVGE